MRVSPLCLGRHFWRAPPIDSGLLPHTKQFANLPERYLLRKTRRLLYKSYPHPAFRTLLQTTWPSHSMDRPWTDEHRLKREGSGHKEHGVFVRPIRNQDWLWYRGDRAQIVKKGCKDEGRQGYINYIVQERNWVCLEGLNCKKELILADKDFPGVLVLKEQPLTVPEDIMLVDPSDELPTEVEWRFTEDGRRVRISKRTGLELPIPTQSESTVDYKVAAGYVENDKDTKAKEVEKITYEPSLATFEMDIMEKKGIEEPNEPRRTFWY